MIREFAKENNVLFCMADKAITPAEQESLLLDFSKMEDKQENGHSKGDYVMLINDVYWSKTQKQNETKTDK